MLASKIRVITFTIGLLVVLGTIFVALLYDFESSNEEQDSKNEELVEPEEILSEFDEPDSEQSTDVEAAETTLNELDLLLEFAEDSTKQVLEYSFTREELNGLPVEDQLNAEFFYLTWSDEHCTYGQGFAKNQKQVESECQSSTILSYKSIAYVENIQASKDPRRFLGLYKCVPCEDTKSTPNH